MNLIACAHPGKIGDTLFTLPAIRELCRLHNAKADLFVRPFCEPARDLIEYQSCINKMHTFASYKEINCRLQGLTDFPNKEKYKSVFDISWKKMEYFPLPESLAVAAGLPRSIGRNLFYEIPDTVPEQIFGLGEYIVLTTKSQGLTLFKDLFESFIQASPWPVIVMGGKEEKLDCGIDMTGLGFLDMARIIACSKAYLGVFSSPLVVAQGFKIPKTCVFNGRTWHPTQILKDGETEYLVDPTVEELIESVGRKLTVERILN